MTNEPAVSNTKASCFRANRSPGPVSGSVHWPPVCFYKLAICQLCSYLWHEVMTLGPLIDAKHTGVNVGGKHPCMFCIWYSQVKSQKSKQIFLFWSVFSTITSRKCKFSLLFCVMVPFRNRSTELSAEYFWVSKLFLRVVRNDLADDVTHTHTHTTNRWRFRRFSSSDPPRMGFF